MGRDRLRVLALSLVYVGLAAVSAFVLDWFEASVGSARITLGLRDATVCVEGRCISAGLGSTRGLGTYTYGAWLTFWGTAGVTLLVGFQAFSRIAAGDANPRLSRLGVIGAMSMLASAAATAFVLAPEPGTIGDVLGVRFERTAAPLLMMLAHVAGVFALHDAAHDTLDDDVGEYRPVVVAKPAADRAASGVERARPGAGPTAEAPGAVRAPPPHLRKRLRYVALSAELTRAGIDARREDGSSQLVLWRDVVGVIARRLPPELDGETFVDVVSTAGATLRVLAWTRLLGEPLLGAGDDRARSLVTFVAAHCPEARIDPATRAFVEDGEPPAQLEHEADLAAYDARLA